MDVEDIRRQYPDPVRSEDALNPGERSGQYCVGGALECALDGDEKRMRSFGAFPGGSVLEGYLMQANPTLDVREADAIAGHIITANDTGDFEDAWAWLRKGLEA